jgi:hypothetical protein
MSEPTLEKLNGAESICVDHLRQAQVLGVSLAEYCRSFDLDLSKLENERLKGEVTRHSERTVLLEEELRWWKAQVFGRSAQHHSPDTCADQQMLFNEAEVLTAIEATDAAHANRTTHIAAHERAHTGGRKAIPKEFPRKDIPHDIAEHEKCCPHDGSVLERFGEEVRERYGYRRPKIWVERHIRHRYGCPTARFLVMDPPGFG